MKFANIPDEVLGLPIVTFDDEISLKDALLEITCEDILEAKYIIETDKHGSRIASFTAWTDHKVIILIYSVFGYCLIDKPRNP